MSVRGHLLEAQAFETKRHLVVYVRPGFVDGGDEPLGVVIHHAGERVVREASMKGGDLAQRGGNVPVKSLHPQSRDQDLTQHHLCDGIQRHPSDLALPWIVLEYRMQDLVMAED